MNWILTMVVFTFCLGIGHLLHTANASDIPVFEEPKEREIIPGECRVTVDFGRTTLSNRCSYNDEVVTGSQNGYLLCSRLRVSCP